MCVAASWFKSVAVDRENDRRRQSHPQKMAGTVKADPISQGFLAAVEAGPKEAKDHLHACLAFDAAVFTAQIASHVLVRVNSYLPAVFTAMQQHVGMMFQWPCMCACRRILCRRRSMMPQVLLM